jgi:hypothetical protein
LPLFPGEAMNITVKGCGACPFLNHDFESLDVSGEQCNATEERIQKWNCRERSIPAECPLRVESITVEKEEEV